MNAMKHLGIGAVLLGLTACYAAPDQYSPMFGKAVWNNAAQQIVPPSVAEPAGPPDLNGVRAASAIDRYVRDRTTPLENFSTLSTTGAVVSGGGGGGGGGVGASVGAAVPAPMQ